ncbi:L-type lectin-domain containing protein [Actinoplanes sp. NPDC051861]|uniref:L-type lectin-domain containing protein n=1 Tax=Actinoplanes sp. NPDC051861 TaxID=3155170 RepID=UPI0034491538
MTVAPAPALAGLPGNDDLAFNGTAQTYTVKPSKAEVLRLTGGGYRQAGSVWSTERIDVTESFETTFEVYLHSGVRGADGLAFVVQSVGPRALGGWGGGLGYRGIRPSVAVEFDDYHNVGDPAGDHVAVSLRGNPDFNTAYATVQKPLFKRPFTVRVAYDAPLNGLLVDLDGQPALNATVDLAAELGTGRAWIGFTGSTGHVTSKQDIRSWRLP